MKKILLSVCFLLFFVGKSEAQTLYKFFDKFADDERFDYVSLSKSLMNMASIFGEIAIDDKKLISKMNGLKMLTLAENSDSILVKSVSNECNLIIENGNFETVAQMRSNGERINILYRIIGLDNADLVIITKGKTHFNCVWLKAKLTKDEMMKYFSAIEN